MTTTAVSCAIGEVSTREATLLVEPATMDRQPIGADKYTATETANAFD